MKNIPNKRTLMDIQRYIKMASSDGILKMSMMDIAKATDYSNATVHRSIKALEADGLIQVIPRKAPRHPNTIVYIGPDNDEVDQLLRQAHVAITNLSNASSEVNNVVTKLQDVIALLDVPNQQYIEFQ